MCQILNKMENSSDSESNEMQCHACYASLDVETQYRRGVPNNSIVCRQKHYMCIPCIQDRIESIEKELNSCAGLGFVCPKCVGVHTFQKLSNIEVLVCQKGTWRDALFSL